MDILAMAMQFFGPSSIIAHNMIVVAGCAALFVILFVVFSTVGFLGYMILMFIKRENAGTAAGMRSMIIMLIIPLVAGIIDFVYCMVLFMKNIRF